MTLRAQAKPNYRGKDFRTTEEKLLNKANTCYKHKYTWPDKASLIKSIALSSFEAVGRAYGVSGNAIKKLCKRYNLPIHKKELIKLYQTNYSNCIV